MFAILANSPTYIKKICVNYSREETRVGNYSRKYGSLKIENEHCYLNINFFQYFSDILGGLSPEELSKEPSNIIDPMFDTLLELATNDQQNTDEEIRALASACLLSLSVAYGDTGRLNQGLLRVWT